MHNIKQTLTCKFYGDLLQDIQDCIELCSGNMIKMDHHKEGELIFVRINWSSAKSEFKRYFIGKLGNNLLDMKVQMQSYTPNVAVFVTKEDHCLKLILKEHAAGNLKINIPLVISNHNDLADLCHDYRVDFKYLPIVNKQEQERQVLSILKKEKIDLIVLAKYMQILSADFVSEYPNKIINIHHSLLPAFAGARPYQQAFDRGVKVIGATGHYVISDLDQGPIIAQDSAPVEHNHGVEDLKFLGKSIESKVLLKSIRAHIDLRVMINNNKTVVF